MKNSKFPLLFAALVFLTACAEKSPPTIMLNGDEEMYILLGDQFNDPGLVATDYRGKDISDRVQIVGSVDDNAGYYPVDYLVTDKKGTTSLATRNVVRGFRNSDISGVYDVSHSASNGGGSYNFTGTVTADSGDDISFTIDNFNCAIAPVVLSATMNDGALQFNIPDQTDGAYSISNGNYNNINGGTAQNVSLSISFKTFNGSITYDHSATWTKQ